MVIKIASTPLQLVVNGAHPSNYSQGLVKILLKKRISHALASQQATAVKHLAELRKERGRGPLGLSSLIVCLML